MFGQYQFWTPNGWEETKLSGDGLAEEVVFEPGHTYNFREWIDVYDYPDAKRATACRILLPMLGTQPKIWSEPFTIPIPR